ncbi:rhomboid family intramembrane serine protease [Planctomicrobium piriforme]|uniref:GlpG protein n=1 Tax=Planctomicrobium piriforme TaxID=1576369 RepID=A0A1I3JA23_9PLAN|nr:rhomboid family intramembrane serine protease [Planctomicrobium piriforme]SFI56966.1 GlpG protein [Planctomicrobium piriforme]
MRRIGTLPTPPLAERFHRYLAHRGIKNRMDVDSGKCEIWVIEESQVQVARDELAAFVANPESKAFDAPLPVPISNPDAPKPPRIKLPRGSQTLWITSFITLLCVALTVAANYGNNPEVTSWLLMTTPGTNGLQQVAQGQVWRLISPIFLHSSNIHLGFNIYMFWILGGMIERNRGSVFLLLLILTIAVLSDLAQFYARGPAFGGLSGVVYGLFGFIWLRSMLLPDDGFFMPQQVVTQMIFWAVLCVLLDDLLPVANAAHFGGLAAGMVWGGLPRFWRD